MLPQEQPKLLQKKPDDRYDTVIGVLLSLAMVAGVWHYAVKPAVKHVAVTTPDLDTAPLKPTQVLATDVAPLAVNCPVKTEVPVPIVALPLPPSAVQPEKTASATIRELPQVVLQTIKHPVAPKKPLPVHVEKIVKPAAIIVAPIVTAVAPPPEVPPAPKVVVEVPPPPPVKIVEPVKVQPVATPPAPEIAPGIIVRESFEFATASARLPLSATTRLLEIANLLKNDKRVLKIVGYTDNVGSPKDNHILSLKRAKAVRRFLVNAGIPWTQLTVDGAGPDNPIADNATEEGRGRNRRIEIAEQS